MARTSPPTLPPALPLRTVCARLAVSRKSVVALLRRGTLRGFKIGRDWRVEEAALADFIREQHHAIVSRGRVEQPRPTRTRGAAQAFDRLPGAGLWR